MHPPIKTLFVATSYPANLQDWRGLFIRHLADALARRDMVHDDMNIRFELIHQLILDEQYRFITQFLVLKNQSDAHGGGSR